MDLNVRQLQKIINNPVVWKGPPPYDFPVGNVPCIITPKTNKDYTNTQPAPFGKPRPLKQHRLGRVVEDNNAYKTTNSYYQTILQRIMDAPAATIVNGRIGGNRSGSLSGAVSDVIVNQDVNEIVHNNETNTQGSQTNCYTYSKIPYIVDYKPIINETQTPNATTTTKLFCCNEERKAIRMVNGANTNVKQNYYLTTKEYLQKRCLTYPQNSYDFYYKNNKTYVYQCRGNTNSTCKQAFYNPNNQLFPVEGSVRNSAYINKLKSATISCNILDVSKQMYQAPQLPCSA